MGIAPETPLFVPRVLTTSIMGCLHSHWPDIAVQVDTTLAISAHTTLATAVCSPKVGKRRARACIQGCIVTFLHVPGRIYCSHPVASQARLRIVRINAMSAPAPQGVLTWSANDRTALELWIASSPLASMSRKSARRWRKQRPCNASSAS